MKAGANHSGRKAGVPDGINYKDWPRHVRAAKKKTARIMKRMTELKLFEADNDKAKAAIETAVQIMNQKGEDRTRLQAAKTILEFTQRKPVAASEVTLNRAEAFLDAIAKDENIGLDAFSGTEGIEE